MSSAPRTLAEKIWDTHVVRSAQGEPDLLFIDLHISLDIGAIFLMMLGAQWYILFNVIAGASSIPNDLREMGSNMQLTRRLRWRRIILPAIFPYYVTGGITAAGGAWNATIVAEEVSIPGSNTGYYAFGLGSMITDATANGQYALLAASVVAMGLTVVFINRLFWKKIYRMAEGRFSLNV